MITSKQSWFILKLMKELEELDKDAYDTAFFVTRLNYAANNYDDYATSKKEASEDIALLLAEKEKFNK